MFTGLVEATGEIIRVEPRQDGARLALRAPFAAEVKSGDSIAVNGCCLTAVALDSEMIGFDLLRETLDRTNLGSLTPGSVVNLERALAANARLGGHFVQGHVDDTAEVFGFAQTGADWRLEVALDSRFEHYVVHKGAIAIDGISLTVADLLETSFVCWIIPHTRGVTNLHARRAGERVNLEFDLLAKYVERIVSRRS
ncbi:MAG TPA: riboflavin synthase [Chthoniobacteraceae bacterium]|jgi:riboflavin synthase|nr:riboflavin synthase [Chthoniobacteraceae bacterium]